MPGRLGSALLGGVLVVGLGAAPPAAALVPLAVDQGYTVDSAVDEIDNGCVPGTTTAGTESPAGDRSLREALCMADALGGPSTITVALPSGSRIALTAGQLVYGTRPGTLQLNGNGVVLDAEQRSRILELDPTGRGGVDVHISSVVFRNGRAADIGGGAIVAGAFSGPGRDVLTLTRSVFEGNASASTASNDPGGAVQFIGGDLDITSGVFSGNSTAGSPGGAVHFEAVAPLDALTVVGTTFVSNTVTQPNERVLVGGGALSTVGGSAEVSDSSFRLNASRPAAGVAAITGGGAVLSSSTLRVLRSTFADNTTDSAVPDQLAGGAVQVLTGTAELQYNRFHRNAASNGPQAVLTNEAGAARATGRNWFGCAVASGPGCDTRTGTGLTPFLTFVVSTEPASLVLGATTRVTASMLVDSAGGDVPPFELSAFNDESLSFASSSDTGSFGDRSAVLRNGTASTSFTPVAAGGEQVSALLDSAVGRATLKVVDPLVIATTALPPARTGLGYTATVSASGGTASSRSFAPVGPLPAGLSLSSDGVLSGTPTGYGLQSVTVRLSDTDPVQQVEHTLDLLLGTDLPTGTSPTGLAASPDGSTVYVADSGGTTLSTLSFADGDRTTAPTVGSVTVGAQPVAVEPAADGRVYVSLAGEAKLAVLHEGVLSTVAHRSFKGSQGLALSPDGAHLFVANFRGQTVTTLTTGPAGSLPVVRSTVAVGGRPADLAVIGDRLYVGDFTGSRVRVYAISGAAALTLLGDVPVGVKPTYLSVAGTRLAVSNVGSAQVSVLDTTSGPFGAVASTTGVGARPYGVAADTASDRVYASSVTDSTITGFLGLASGPTRDTALPPLPVGAGPNALLHLRNGDGRTLLSSGNQSATVTLWPLGD